MTNTTTPRAVARFIGVAGRQPAGVIYETYLVG
jgi:hypothetical protein